MPKTKISVEMIEHRSNLSYEEFVEEYAKPSKPVILTGEMDNWDAKTMWNLDFFKSRYGSMPVIVRRSKQKDEYFEVELGEYIDYLSEPEKEEDPLYLADWDFSAELPELLQHYQTPEIFRDWLQLIPRSVMPPMRWFYIGPATSGTRLHIDVAMTSAWNGVFTGRKRWVFFAPEDTPFMYDGDVDAFNPDLDKFPLFANAKPIYGIQNPHEIMFTPSGWWHQVINEEDCVSLTENFINEVNFEQALLPYARRVLSFNQELRDFQKESEE